MSWQSSVNQGPWVLNSYPECARPWFVLKALLKGLGWTVGPSGDGLAGYSAGDGLLHWGAGAAGLGNVRAWYAISDPDGQRHWLVQIDSTGTGWQNKCLLACSHNTAFAGGAAAVRATSLDEVNPRGQGAIGNVDFWTPGATSYFHLFAQDSDVNGVWPFHMVSVAALGAPGATMGHFGWLALYGEDAGDTDPCVWTGRGSQWAGLSLFGTGAGAAAAGWHDIAGVPAWSGMGAAAAAYFDANYHIPPMGAPGLQARPDGTRPTHFADFWSTQVGPVSKGVSDWIYQPTMAIGNAKYNTVRRDQLGTLYVVMEGGAANAGICYPGWPSVATCPLPDLGGGVVIEDVHILPEPGIPPDTTPPTIAVVSPVAGASIATDTAFVVDVTDAIGLGLVVLTVEQPAGGPHEVVWLRDAFASTYVASTRTAIANGYRFTIRRAGGWYASPTFHVEAIDLGGNLGL